MPQAVSNLFGSPKTLAFLVISVAVVVLAGIGKLPVHDAVQLLTATIPVWFLSHAYEAGKKLENPAGGAVTIPAPPPVMTDSLELNAGKPLDVGAVIADIARVMTLPADEPTHPQTPKSLKPEAAK